MLSIFLHQTFEVQKVLSVFLLKIFEVQKVLSVFLTKTFEVQKVHLVFLTKTFEVHKVLPIFLSQTFEVQKVQCFVWNIRSAKSAMFCVKQLWNKVEHSKCRKCQSTMYIHLFKVLKVQINNACTFVHSAQSAKHKTQKINESAESANWTKLKNISSVESAQ